MPFARRCAAAGMAALLTCSLTGCQSGSEPLDVPTTQTVSDDFQPNAHQSEAMSFLETDAGYYFTSGNLYYINKEDMKTTILCAKPDCDHTDNSYCNARIHAYYLLRIQDKVYYIAWQNNGKVVCATALDGTQHETLQNLKYREFTHSESSTDQAIYHRGYIYFVSDDILYRTKIGAEKDDVEILWQPETASEPDTLYGIPIFQPNGLHFTLWAEGDTVYFMANIPDEDDVAVNALYALDPESLAIRKVWTTPTQEEVGTWETTGVKVSQWYVKDGSIYFYLSGGDFWRGDLSTGKNEKLADTHEQTLYGSAVFSDQYLCLLNDIPVAFYGETEPTPGGMFHSNGDTIFVYSLDGKLVRDISLKGLYEDPSEMAQIDLLINSGEDLFFLTTGYTASALEGPFGGLQGNKGHVNLCRADLQTGEVSILYQFR